MRPILDRYLVRILSGTTYVATEHLRVLSQSLQVNVGIPGLRPLPFKSFAGYNSEITVQREAI